MNTVDIVIRILEIVIWPVTLLAVILVFRREFINAMGRLGSFEAGASGISMTFEPKLDQAKKLFGDLRSEGMKKSGPGTLNQNKMEGTPMEQVAKLRNEIHSTLVEMARENNIDLGNTSTYALCMELTGKGVISSDKGKLLGALLEVLNSANASITQQQVNEIVDMYNTI